MTEQRLIELGYQITPTNEFDEYTEEALRSFQQEQVYTEDYQQANGYETEQYSGSEDQQAEGPAISEDGNWWWDGNHWQAVAANTQETHLQEPIDPEWKKEGAYYGDKIGAATGAVVGAAIGAGAPGAAIGGAVGGMAGHLAGGAISEDIGHIVEGDNAATVGAGVGASSEALPGSPSRQPSARTERSSLTRPANGSARKSARPSTRPPTGPPATTPRTHPARSRPSTIHRSSTQPSTGSSPLRDLGGTEIKSDGARSSHAPARPNPPNQGERRQR